MTFTLKNLENHSGSGAGVKIWSYSTSDAAATVKAADYFLSATTLLTAGDLIVVSASEGTFLLTVASATASTVTTIGGGALEASETHDFGSLVDGAGETGSITVTGAALGDFVMVSCSLDLQDMILTAYVSAANTVEYRLQNESGSTVDLASATIKVRVFK